MGCFKIGIYEVSDEYRLKYGEPADTFEFFSRPYAEGDGKETKAVKDGKRTFASFFEKEEGKILVRISEEGCIELIYEDASNAEIKRTETKVVIQSDI